MQFPCLAVLTSDFLVLSVEICEWAILAHFCSFQRKSCEKRRKLPPLLFLVERAWNMRMAIISSQHSLTQDGGKVERGEKMLFPTFLLTASSTSFVTREELEHTWDTFSLGWTIFSFFFLGEQQPPPNAKSLNDHPQLTSLNAHTYRECFRGKKIHDLFFLFFVWNVQLRIYKYFLPLSSALYVLMRYGENAIQNKWK